MTESRLPGIEGRRRATSERKSRMARHSSLQRGSVETQRRRNGTVFTIRYRIRDVNSRSGWQQKRERLPECTSKKEALLELSKRLNAVNIDNNEPEQKSELTFAE